MKDSTLSCKTKPATKSVPWTSGLFWLGVWTLCFFVVGEPLLLPSPWAVLLALAGLMITPAFWLVTAGSLGRIMAGFLLGLLAGAALAALCAAVPALRGAVELPLGVIKATPVASFAILALLFLRGPGFSVFIAFLMVLPLSWSNILEGIENTDKNLLEVAKVYRFSKAYTVRYIYLPSLFPYLLTAARVGLGFAWKAGIAGEVIAIPGGAIGTQLYNAKVSLDTPGLFAWTAVVILLSILLERGMVALLGRAAPIREQGGKRP